MHQVEELLPGVKDKARHCLTLAGLVLGILTHLTSSYPSFKTLLSEASLTVFWAAFAWKYVDQNPYHMTVLLYPPCHYHL